MGTLTPPSTNDLADGMGRRSNLLKRNGEDSKEEDLNSCSRSIPFLFRCGFVYGEEKESSKISVRGESQSQVSSWNRVDIVIAIKIAYIFRVKLNVPWRCRLLENSLTAILRTSSNFSFSTMVIAVPFLRETTVQSKIESSNNSPKGSRDTVLPGDVGGLEKSGSPGPLRNDNGSGQSGLDHTTSGAVGVKKLCREVEMERNKWNKLEIIDHAAYVIRMLSPCGAQKARNIRCQPCVNCDWSIASLQFSSIKHIIIHNAKVTHLKCSEVMLAFPLNFLSK